MIEAVILAALFLLILYYLGPVGIQNPLKIKNEHLQNASTIRGQIEDAVSNKLNPVEFYGKYGTDLEPWQLNALMNAQRRNNLTDEKIKTVLETRL